MHQDFLALVHNIRRQMSLMGQVVFAHDLPRNVLAAFDKFLRSPLVLYEMFVEFHDTTLPVERQHFLSSFGALGLST
jgi:hypothetical protein